MESTWLVEALAKRYNALRFVVQMSEATASNMSSSLATLTTTHPPRVTVQIRTPQTPQTVEDAAVYLLWSTTRSHVSLISWVQEELDSHLGVLRGNPNAMVLLMLQLRPDPGSVDPSVEASAYLHDMTMSQLAGEDRSLGLTETENLITGIHDNLGRLVVVSKLRSRLCATVVLVIRYQPAKSSSIGGSELMYSVPGCNIRAKSP